MVENFDDQGLNQPLPEPPSSGDLAADLEEGRVAPQPVAKPAPAPVYRERSAFEPSSPTPPTTIVSESKHPIFPIVTSLALLPILAVAWIASKQPTEAASPASGAPSPAFAVGDPSQGTTAVTSELDKLAKQVKDLQGRIESLPKFEPAPDLGPLQTKVADLAKSHETVVAVPQRLTNLDNHVSTLDKSLSALRSEVATLQVEVKEAATTVLVTPKPETPKPETPKPETADVNLEGQGMSQAVELFKGGKYKEANDLFRKLEDSHPNDARVWYFAALTNGLTTKQWVGETDRLATKGVEREQAGTPESAKIDALFADLKPATLKSWLAAYRKRAQK